MFSKFYKKYFFIALYAGKFNIERGFISFMISSDVSSNLYGIKS